MPPAAAVPRKNDDGRLNNGPSPAKSAVDPTASATSTNKSESSTVAAAKPNAANSQGIAACQMRSPLDALDRPQMNIAAAPATKIAAVTKPVARLEKPIALHDLRHPQSSTKGGNLVRKVGEAKHYHPRVDQSGPQVALARGSSATSARGDRSLLFVGEPSRTLRAVGQELECRERKKTSGYALDQKNPLPAAKARHAVQLEDEVASGPPITNDKGMAIMKLDVNRGS